MEGEGDTPERHYLVTIGDGHVEIAERDRNGVPTATIVGSVAAWVRALGPDGATDDLSVTGNRGLADALLSGFSEAAQRSAQAA